MKDLVILVDVRDLKLLLQYKTADQLSSVFELDVSSNKVSVSFAYYWLLTQVKPLLFDLLPVDHLETKLGVAVTSHVMMSEVARKFVAVIEATNACVKQLVSLPPLPVLGDRTLLYNVNDSFYLPEIAKALPEGSGDRLICLDLDTGWDGLKRARTRPAVLLSPAEMMDFVRAKGIVRVVTMNTHYLEITLAQYQLYMLAVFSKLGVEFIAIDIDPHEAVGATGQILKMALHHPGFRHLSIQPHLNVPWDKKLRPGQIGYLPVITNPDKPVALKQLDDDYQVVLASHTRLKSVLHWLERLVFLSHHLSFEPLMDSAVVWYFAAKKTIIDDPATDLLSKLSTDGQLFLFFEALLAFIKLRFVAKIKTDREFCVFGDEGWEQLLPGNYKQEYLDNEGLEKLSNEGRSLFVLPNLLVSYLESQPALMRCLGRGDPYLIMPATVTTDTFSGLRVLEAATMTRCHELLENINPVTRGGGFQTAAGYLNKVMCAGMGQLGHLIMNRPGGMPKGENLFGEQAQAHQNLLEERVREFLEKKSAFVLSSLEVLFREKPVAFDMEASPVFQEDLVQRLFWLKKKGLA